MSASLKCSGRRPRLSFRSAARLAEGAPPRQQCDDGGGGNDNGPRQQGRR